MNLFKKTFILLFFSFILFPSLTSLVLTNPNDTNTENSNECENFSNNLDELFKRGEKFYKSGYFNLSYKCFQIFVENINNNRDNAEKRKQLHLVYIYKGAIETLLGNFPSSIKSYQDALTAMYSPPINIEEIESNDTKKKLAMIYNNIYISAAHDKQEKLAREYKKKHDEIRSLEKGTTNKLYADDSFERGSIYFGVGIFNLERGLNLRQSPNKTKEMIETLEKAIQALENAEKEYSKSEEGAAKNVMSITTKLNQSAGLEVSGKPEEAKEKFNSAMDEREKSDVDTKYLESLSQVLINLVEIKREINKITPGKYKEEDIKIQSNYARKIQEFIYPNQKDCNNLPKRTWSLHFANYYFGEAKDLFFKNQFDESLIKAQCAEKYLQLPEKGDIYYNQYQYTEGRQYLIKIFTLQKNIYKKKSLEKEKLTKLNSILDLIREYYLYSYSIGLDKEDEIKREKYRDFFEETFLSYTRRKEDIKDAFLVSEKFRSITISDFINLNKSLSVPNINSEDKKKLIKLKKEINQTASQSMAFRFLDLDLVDITLKNNNLISEFEKLDIKLKKENPEYKKIRYSSDLNFNVDKLISSLSEVNKVMLHFFFTDVEKNSGNLHVTILGSKNKSCFEICSYHYKDIIESKLSEKILFYKLLLSINPREIQDVSENLLVMVDKGNVTLHSDKEEKIKTFIGTLEKPKAEKMFAHPCPVKNERFKCEIYIIPKDKYTIWIKELSQDLHSQLISPLYKKKIIQPTSEKEIGEQLVIAPDKSLYFLPFSSLLDEKEKYFLESHTHSYTLSGDVWYYNHKRYIETKHTTIEGLIVGAFQDFETLPKYCDRNVSVNIPLKVMTCRLSKFLSEHEEEMDFIKNTFDTVKNQKIDIQKDIPSKFLDNAVYTLKGILATKENLQDILTLSESRYVRYLHIVGHGVSNSIRPGLNSILLSPESLNPIQADDKKEIENSLSRFLTEADVMGMNFSSEIVTLSSCSSATGFESDAEGNIGLPRAFIMSGARNVLGPLWNVNSTKTKEIMGTFYQKVNKLRAVEKDGERKSENEALILQSTLNEFRKREDLHNHPYYWAGFVIYGE